MNREDPKTGEIYKNSKGANYQIICVGFMETKEKMVVCRRYYRLPEDTPPALFGMDIEICIRPLDVFMSEFERVKK